MKTFRIIIKSKYHTLRVCYRHEQMNIWYRQFKNHYGFVRLKEIYSDRRHKANRKNNDVLTKH